MKRFLLYLLTAVSIVACSEGEPADNGSDNGGGNTPTTPTITLNKSSVSFDELADEESISFSTTADWIAEIVNDRADGWLSVTPQSGSAGDASITIKAKENDTPDERNASVRIKAGSASKTISVSQKQKDALTVTASKFEVEAEGGEVKIEVKANIDFEYAIDESAKEWIKYEGTRAMKTSTLTFSVAKNDDTDKREGKIAIKSGEFNEVVTIYQAGSEPSIVISQNEYVVSSDGETILVEVTSNVDVAVELPADVDWISESTTRATSTNTYYFDIQPNEDYDQRTAEIKFTNKENGLSEVVAIKQMQRDAIVLADSEYEFGIDGGNLDFEILTNVDVAITISDNAQDWIQQVETRGLEAKALYFNVAACSSEEDREGKITISGGNATQTITVKQSGLKEILEKEREALIAFYNATGGDNWTRNDNWCSDKPVYEWYGVQCFGRRVWSVILDNNNLTGVIPEEICTLSSLVYLNLCWNNISGCIPNNINRLTELQTLDLSYNKISGQIPECIGELSNLEGLALYSNLIGGEIPYSIGNLKNLHYLYLHFNRLTGEIPKSICNLKNLAYLYLDNNRLGGCIPDNIGDMTSLELFFIGNSSIGAEGGEIDLDIPKDKLINHISGEIPKAIGNLKKLRSFGADCNKLTGKIPDELWLIPTLESVTLGGNYLTGELSPAIGNARNLKQLWLSNNCLTGSIPNEICELSNLEELLLSNTIGVIAVKPFDIDSQYNKFEGELPQNISKLQSLIRLELSCNKLSGAIPDGLWNIPTLVSVSLDCNYFSGELSPAIGNAKNIHYLTLANNHLSGTIPNEICNLSSLYYFNVGNYTSVNDFEINPVTQFNSIEGEIPEDIYKMSELTYFEAINNNITGQLPEYFAFNPKMKGITPGLHNNRMSGVISKDVLNSENWQSWDVNWNILQQQEGYGFELDYGDMYESTDYSKDGEVKQLQAATKGDGIDIIFMGDAYSDRLIADGTYNKVMNTAMEKFFMEEPYKSYRDHFNVYSVAAVSENEVYNLVSSTAFAGYFGGGTLVGGNDQRVFSYAQKAIGAERMDDALIVVMMNSEAYAGTCYMYSPTDDDDWGDGVSISYFPVGVDDAALAQVLHHETGGHGFSKLADEYAYEHQGAISDSEISSKKSMEFYGWWKNADFTSDPTKVKWNHFLSDARYANDGLGVFEGAFTYWTGVWRPTENSIMRHNTGGFNAPSREAIYYRIHKLAYGADWEYDYEKFVEWDARNRKTASATRGVPYRLDILEDFKPLHAPVVMKTSWRNAKNNAPAKKTIAPSGNTGNAGRNLQKVSMPSVGTAARKTMKASTSFTSADGRTVTVTVTTDSSGATKTTYSK